MTKRANRYSRFSPNTEARTVYGKSRRKSNLISEMDLESLKMHQWSIIFEK